MGAKIYLSQFHFPDKEEEYTFFFSLKRTCYDTCYPFGILSAHGLTSLELEPVTILYGGSGSGKTTALNVIGEKLGLSRETLYNRSYFFEDYTRRCTYELNGPIPGNSRMITSDDVFDFMMNLRMMNQGIDRMREHSARFSGCQFVIATHSPFLLAMKGARIYDLDENPVDVKPWTKLKSVQAFYEFFKLHRDAFEQE